MKSKITAIDLYIVAVLVLFYIVADILYPIIMWNMNIQISDWWIAANVIVPLVEIICCMIIKVTKETDPTAKADQRAMINLMAQIVAAISGTAIIPGMTSGESGSVVSDETYEETEEIEEEEEEDEPVG